MRAEGLAAINTGTTKCSATFTHPASEDGDFEIIGVMVR